MFYLTSSRAPSPWKMLPPTSSSWGLLSCSFELQLNARNRTQRHRELEPESFYFLRPISESPLSSPVYFCDMIWGTIIFPILFTSVVGNNASMAASCRFPIFDSRLPYPNTFIHSPGVTYHNLSRSSILHCFSSNHGPSLTSRPLLPNLRCKVRFSLSLCCLTSIISDGVEVLIIYLGNIGLEASASSVPSVEALLGPLSVFTFPKR
jgi:hypothetical protein